MNDVAKKTNLELSHEVATLTARMDTSMEHIADQLGQREAQARSTSDVLEALSTDFIESHNGLSDQFKSLENAVNNIAADMRPATPDRTELYKALIAAQLEIKNAAVNVDNEFTGKKYADLASVMDAVREPLANHGLAIIQLTADVDEHILGIRTLLIHESGQSISDVITMRPVKTDPQGIGSCRTYMRRYAVLAICAIAGAVDDDGQGAGGDPNDYERITSQEAEAILVKADDLFGERADAALAKMLDRLFGGITRVGDIKAGEANVAITNLENAAATMAVAASKKDVEAKKQAAQEKADKAEADEK